MKQAVSPAVVGIVIVVVVLVVAAIGYKSLAGHRTSPPPADYASRMKQMQTNSGGSRPPGAGGFGSGGSGSGGFGSGGAR